MSLSVDIVAAVEAEGTSAKRSAKVLVVCLRNDYGRPERGLSPEYYNLWLPVQQVATEPILFGFDTRLQERSKDEMNRELLDLIRSERPDVSIFALFTDQILPATVDEARRYTTTLSYFVDDMWRRDFVAEWVPHFDHFTTPHWSLWRRYRAQGMEGAIHWPFGYNDEIYRRKDLPKRYDVSFVGGIHPWRVFVVERLRKAGFEVAAFGGLWPGGKISQEEMVDVLNASRINLNLSNSRQWDVRYLSSSWPAIKHTIKSPKDRETLKARHFEIPPCGGFQLTYYCDDLERHFELGEEVVVYTCLEDLIDKVRFYLEHEDERERIASAGWRRAQRDHSMRKRVIQLLDTLGAVGAGRAV